MKSEYQKYVLTVYDNKKKIIDLTDTLNMYHDDYNKKDLENMIKIRKQITKLTRENENLEKQIEQHFLINDFVFNNASQENTRAELNELFIKLNDSYTTSVTNKLIIKSFLLYTISNIGNMIYLLLLKLNITLRHKTTKKYVETITWLIFKLTIVLIKICFYFISAFSQSNIGCFILLCMFCSFYSTEYGYVIINNFLDILITFFPNVGIQRLKDALIIIGNTKTKGLALLNFGYKHINKIKPMLNHIYKTSEHLIAIGNQVTITAEKTKGAATTALTLMAANHIASNLKFDELQSMIKQLYNEVIDLRQDNHELRVENSKLNQAVNTIETDIKGISMDVKTIETNIKGISMEAETQTKLITNFGTDLELSKEDVGKVFTQLLHNTESMPNLITDFEKLLLANQETNGKLFKEIIQAIKKGDNLETFLNTFISNNAIGTTFTVSKQFIKYFSEMTGIGTNMILNDDTRHRVGLGGTKKKCYKRKKTKSKRRHV
jgi:hypothetical protein